MRFSVCLRLWLLASRMTTLRSNWRLCMAGEKRIVHIPAFLEDHAMLLNGMMDLIDATVAEDVMRAAS